MALTKEKKGEVLKKLEDVVAKSAGIVFVKFKGLSVADTTNLRKQLRAEQVGYTVAKKTLMRRAFTGGKVEGSEPAMDGEIALAYGADPVAPARGIAQFAKKFKEQLSIVGGIFENKFLNAAEMNAIASIPATPVLRGMFVNVINSPIQGMVIALNEYAKKKGSNQ